MVHHVRVSTTRLHCALYGKFSDTAPLFRYLFVRQNVPPFPSSPSIPHPFPSFLPPILPSFHPPILPSRSVSGSCRCARAARPSLRISASRRLVRTRSPRASRLAARGTASQVASPEKACTPTRAARTLGALTSARAAQKSKSARRSTAPSTASRCPTRRRSSARRRSRAAA